MDDPRNINAARFGERFQPCRDIDTVTENVAGLENDVAEIDPDAHREAAFGGQSAVSLENRIAQGGGATRSLDDTVELAEHPLPCRIDNVSAEFRNSRLDHFDHKRRQFGEALRFVAGEKPAVAGHQNRRKSAPDAPFCILGHDGCAPIARCGNDAPRRRGL